MKQTRLSAFTLVELIVVIVILAILATIAFLSFGSQASSARDSTRLSDLGSISKGLMVYQSTKGSYPSPDKPVKIWNGGLELGTQGEAGSSVKSNIKAGADGFVDPLKKKNYLYSINKAAKKYRLGAFLENKDSVAFNYGEYSNSAHAESYDGYLYLKGDNIAILYYATGTTYTPLGDLGSGAVVGLTDNGLDISQNANDGMVAVVNNGDSAVAADRWIETAYTDILDLKPVIHFDMETLATGKMKNLGTKSIDGTLSGTLVSDGNGKSGKARSFSGTSFESIDFGTEVVSSGAVTVNVLLKKPTINGGPDAEYVGELKLESGEGLLLDTRHDGSIHLGIRGYNEIKTSGNLIKNVNEWYYVTYIYNGGDKESLQSYKIYLNGVEQTLSNGGLNGQSFNANRIGNETYANSGAFGGMIDDFKVYDKALSKSEINYFYDSLK